MPIYEYQCTKCDKIVEKIISASKRDDPQQCPDCKGPCKRKISLFAGKAGKDSCSSGSCSSCSTAST